MAKVNARAQRLFEDGYRACWKGPHLLAVRSGLGAVYDVDTTAETCGCPFFVKSGHPCKHVLGWKMLIARQKALRRLVALILLKVWSDLDDCRPAGTGETIHHG